MHHNKQTNEYTRLRIPTTWIIIALVFFLLIILISAINLLFGGTHYGPRLEIEDFATLIPGMPGNRRKAIESGLYSRSVAEGASIEDVDQSKAFIREGSIQTEYDQNTNIHSGSFLVDIPKLEQSYLISYNWADDESTNTDFPINDQFHIFCVSSEDQIYADFQCDITNNSPQDTSPESQLINNSPYFTTTASGDNIYAVMRYYGDGTPYIEVDADSCGNQKTLKEAVKIVQDWLASIAIPEDYFHIEALDLCPGGF